MTPIAKRTVLKQLELTLSLDDMPWIMICKIARAKVYNKNTIKWMKII